MLLHSSLSLPLPSKEIPKGCRRSRTTRRALLVNGLELCSKFPSSASSQSSITKAVLPWSATRPPRRPGRPGRPAPGGLPRAAPPSLSSPRVAFSRRPSEPSSTAAVRQKMRVDVATPSVERNLITVERAMADFLLSQEDLEGLERTTRRSPYPDSPEIMVLSRKDVVQRSNQKWGSPERLVEEMQKRIRHASGSISGVGKRRLPRNERRRQREDSEGQLGLCGPSGRVVIAAIVMNFGCLVLKLVAWYYTKSHSMFSEFLHSVADLANQVILAVGVHTSTKRPNVVHPYGFSNMQFVSALISGVGIFCVGTGLSMYHGVMGLIESSVVEDLTWAVVVMAVSGLLEATTLGLAIRTLRREATKRKMPVMTFIVTAQDPGVNVVLVEDLAAVVSLVVASACLMLSQLTASPIPDAMGSLLVGLILGFVAVFIIYTNAGRLVGRSIPTEQLQQMNSELERDVMVRAIHDVKGIDMGNHMVRYKAELDLDGRQLARAYLDQLDITLVQEAMHNIKTLEEVEEFMLIHGENLIDTIGYQIDRIERNLKASHPSIRHCDLEIL